MSLKTTLALFLLCVMFGVGNVCYGLVTESIGPDTDHQTVAQQGWPVGIVEIPRHMSRVYSTYGFGSENFYFKCTVDEINELLAIFAKARMRDHVVRIEPGVEKVHTFGKEEIAYNVRLQIVSGIALALARDGSKEALSQEPRLTILTGDDNSIIKRLKWPENLIIESEIPGVSINKDRIKPKRDVYYGLCEFADGSPPVGFVQGVSSWITLWEQKEKDGIGIGRINNKGYFMVLLSEKEVTDLKNGTVWLTVTIGNFLVKAAKTDMRFPVEMLTQIEEQAKPVQVDVPSYYHGRLLFEDGSPPILDPVPWPGAEIMVDFPYTGPAIFDSDGTFKVSLTKEQYKKLTARKDQRNIYIPSYKRKHSASALYVFPASLLSQDKAKAGVVKIPRPKPPRQELSTAESKIGNPIPGFDNIRFEGLLKDKIKGKPLLVCFWDMDQRPSRQCLKELEKQKLALQDKNIVVIAVHSGSKREQEVREWLSKEGHTQTVGIIEGDPYDVLLAWGARGTPWLVLTDDKHIITKAGFTLEVLSPLN